MKSPTRLALLSVLGLTLASCFEDRPLLVAQDDGATPAGAAGTTGAAGTASAGTTGAAGTTSTGAAGSGGPGCDIAPLIKTYNCALALACHDARGSAANLDMASLGWEKRLVGMSPTNSPAPITPSVCAGQGQVELVTGVLPAVGLFLQKLLPNPPCGDRMPTTGPPYLSDTEMACVQAWANALVAQ
jgi:hypothetical protein